MGAKCFKSKAQSATKRSFYDDEESRPKKGWRSDQYPNCPIADRHIKERPTDFINEFYKKYNGLIRNYIYLNYVSIMKLDLRYKVRCEINFILL